MYKIYKTIVNLSEAWLKLCHLTFKTLCQFQSKAANNLATICLELKLALDLCLSRVRVLPQVAKTKLENYLCQ